MFISSRQPRSLRLWWRSKWTLRQWWVIWKTQSRITGRLRLNDIEIKKFVPSFSGTQIRITGSAARPINMSTPTWVTFYRGALHETHWMIKKYFLCVMWITKCWIKSLIVNAGLIISAPNARKKSWAETHKHKVVQIMMLFYVCEILSAAPLEIISYIFIFNTSTWKMWFIF